jgi:amino acid transporter
MGSSGGRKRASSGQASAGAKTASRGQTASNEHTLDIDPENNKSGLWGSLAGLIVFAFIAIPLSAAFSFATNPGTQQLFAGRLSDATTGGYQTFWWIVTIFLFALPFLVGYGVAKLSVKSLAIVGAVVALFVIAVMVLGQLFVF